jgi:hypothetical protein
LKPQIIRKEISREKPRAYSRNKPAKKWESSCLSYVQMKLEVETQMFLMAGALVMMG